MRIEVNTTYPLEMFIVGSDGEPVSGLATTYTIYNSDTNLVIQSGSLTDQGLGIYTGSYSFNTVGAFRVIYNTPSGYSDEIESLIVEESSSLMLKKILGLSQENYRIFDAVYNANHQLVSSTVKTYNTASDCENDINPLASYSMISEYNINNEMTSYKMVIN